MKELIEWLWSTNNTNPQADPIVDVKAVSVKIGRTTYQGAMYTRKTTLRDKQPWLQKNIYLLCEDIPPSHKRNPGSVNTHAIHYLDQDGTNWYVAAHMTNLEVTDWYRNMRPHMTEEEIVEEFYSYHPFGKHFILSVWPFETDNITKTMNITIVEG